MLKSLVKSLNNEDLTVYDKKIEEFSLPIEYLDNKNLLQLDLKKDLELEKNDKQNSILENLFNTDVRESNNIINRWSKYYTNDVEYLKDMQNFLFMYEPDIVNNEELNKIDDILIDVKSDTGFLERYNYIDIENFHDLNDLPLILQILSIHNLAGPIFSFIVPIIMCIIPFFLIKLRGVELSLETYIQFLIETFKNHTIGKSIQDFSTGGLDKKIFVIVSLFFYGWSMYQNILTCKDFYKNIFKIKEYLSTISKFLTNTQIKFENVNKCCGKSMYKFIENNNKVNSIISYYNSTIKKIPLEKINIGTIISIGDIYHCFYKLYSLDTLQNAIKYCLHFNCFINNISCIKNKLNEKLLNFCKFSNKKSTNFKKSYYIGLINGNYIKNSYDLEKKLIITGPNAAGKTTIIKTTIINILLSQQIGVGCYESCTINPYKFIYSYINIPDTSDRDSLFQAEARRCKEILDNFEKNSKKDRHFCIFDEIYSGTNPSEAIASAYSFINYISNNKNFDLMLTTHYIKLCKLLDSNENIKNSQMIVEDKKPTYKIADNISKIKGGIRVLEELNYNKEIIKNAENILNIIDE